MEADSQLRFGRIVAIAGILVLLLGSTSFAASLRTQNFLITAPTPQLANAVAEAAERYRRDLAIHWLGQPLPPWPNPCPIQVVAGSNLAAQGVTTYNPAPVRDFQMEVIGTPERILDSVLPHEVTHTVLATYFGRPLPRWADEGICTTVEHVSERSKHEAKLREFLRSRRGIAVNQLFLMKEYPPDVLPMYAQGYSMCRFLIDQKGPRNFIQFLGDYMQHPSWTANVKRHYDYDSLKELQEYWLAWVAAGGGPVDKYVKRNVGPATQAGSQIAAAPANARPLAQVSTTSPASVQPTSAGAVRLADGRLELAGPVTGHTAQDAISGGRASGNLDHGQLNAPHPPVYLANESVGGGSDGWYMRKRNEVASQDQPDPSASPITPMVPPSVRSSGTYQAAQPQPEQVMSRSGTPIEWAHSSSGEGSGQFVR